VRRNRELFFTKGKNKILITPMISKGKRKRMSQRLGRKDTQGRGLPKTGKERRFCSVLQGFDASAQPTIFGSGSLRSKRGGEKGAKNRSRGSREDKLKGTD